MNQRTPSAADDLETRKGFRSAPYRIASPSPVFTVGVTGHRALHGSEDAERLEARVVELLENLRGLCREHVPSTRCRLLSALATGADQIAASAAVQENERDESEKRWCLHAILPFAREDYRATLNDGLNGADTADVADQSQPRFDMLLEHTDRVLELADWSLPREADASARAAYWKNRRLHTLGEMLVRQSDVLLAIWRGTPPAGIGGTADVMAIALRQRIPVIRIDPDTGLLSLVLPDAGIDDPLHLPTDATAGHLSADEQQEELQGALEELVARVLRPPVAHGTTEHSERSDTPGSHDTVTQSVAEQPKPSDTPDSLDALLGLNRWQDKSEQAAATTLWSIYSWFERAVLPGRRADGTRVGRPPLRLRVDYLSDVWCPPDHERAPHLDATDETLGPTMHAADAIATARGHAYRSSYVITFLGAVLAVWLGLLGLFSAHKWFFVGAELLVLIVLLWLYGLARRKAWHRRWLNARHLAESLRALRPLAWLGLAGRRVTGARARWTAWLSNAVVAQCGIPHGRLTPGALADIACELRWHVDDQKAYHRGNHVRLETLHHRLDTIGRGCLYVAMITAALYVVFFDPWHCFGAAWCTDERLQGVKYVVTVIGAGLPLLAAALAGIRYQGDFERFGKRSHDTLEALDTITRRLDDFERCARRTTSPVDADTPPLFERLASIVIELAEIYESDLEDWRFVYAARPNPDVG